MYEEILKKFEKILENMLTFLGISSVVPDFCLQSSFVTVGFSDLELIFYAVETMNKGRK